MKKIVSFTMCMALFLSMCSVSVYATNNKKILSEQSDYFIQDITYDEYVELKTELLSISSEKMKDEISDCDKDKTNTVYRMYKKTFYYPSNENYKTDLICVFTLSGQNNYFDISEIIVGSKKSDNSKYDKWVQTATQIRNFSGANAIVYATGKFDVHNWTSEAINMSANVATDELRHCTIAIK